jgi:hypothetical protein
MANVDTERRVPMKNASELDNCYRPIRNNHNSRLPHQRLAELLTHPIRIADRRGVDLRKQSGTYQSQEAY